MTSTEIAAASKIMLGTTEAVAMYIGSNKIWELQTGPIIRLPQGYTEVEYIENTSTAYINTWVLLYDSPTNSYNIQCKCYFQPYGNDYEYLFGTEQTSDPYTGITLRYYQRNIEYSSVPNNVSWTRIDNSDGTSTITASCSSTTATNGDNPLTLFGGLWSSGLWRNGRGKIYSFKVTKNGTLVRDLVPCKNSNNVVGLYDLVNNVFYTSPNGEVFVAGPSIYTGSISEYVLNGLIFHLDGIDKGNDGDWLDLIGNIVLTLVGNTSYSTLNGYYFDGDSSSYLQSQNLLWSNNSDITVEVCYKEINTDKKYYIFGFRGERDSKHPLFYIDGSSITWSQGDYVYDASSISTNKEYTISLNSDSGIVNGNSINIKNSTDYWDYNSTNVIRIGLAVSGGAANSPFKGYIYSIRVYNRKLTQQELLQNQSVDDIRFNLGIFSGLQEHDYSQDYFTIESLLDSNEIKMQRSGSPNNPIISYSLDDGETWTTATISGTKSFGTINTGQKIIFKGNNTRLASAWDTYNYFTATKQFKVYGNIMSLLNEDNFITNSEFQNTNTQFAGLFRTDYIIDASNLILPALTLYVGSYNGMFRGATNLSHGPKELLATSLLLDSCSSMFEGCINLEEAPIIHAMTFNGTGSMMRMFCMSRTSKLTTPKLTKGPVLPALTVGSTSYREMFKGNGNLVEVTCLATSGFGNCSDWLVNCSETGTFYKNSGVTVGTNGWIRSTSQIPVNWTVLDYVSS